MRLTRRRVVASAAAGALGAAGLYELADRIAERPARRATGTLRPEQHVLDGVRVIVENGADVLVPPLHHQVTTARIRVEERPRALGEAQRELEHAVARLEQEFAPTPEGLGITLAWGLPYFRRFVAGPARTRLPFDRRAAKPALLDAIRFPSDSDDVVLEDNDVAILLRSDSLEHVEAGARALVDDLPGLFQPTSVRKGFAGGGFDGGVGLPKRMALAAGIPGAELIPDTAELFLGFTSTQKANLGPPRIASFETLGLVNLGSEQYFRGGTNMHLSHLFEDLEAWYVNFDHDERVATTFRPGLVVPRGTQTVPQGPEDVSTRESVLEGFKRRGSIGHSAPIQLTSRLERDVVAEDGVVYRKGTAIPQRADFNTLDNPFFWSARPELDGQRDEPAAGVHFLVFNPSSDDFARNRLAMDGILPDGTRLPLPARARGQGINAVLQTTHRQNFLVPPRRHRSFPLAELLR